MLVSESDICSTKMVKLKRCCFSLPEKQFVKPFPQRRPNIKNFRENLLLSKMPNYLSTELRNEISRIIAPIFQTEQTRTQIINEVFYDNSSIISNITIAGSPKQFTDLLIIVLSSVKLKQLLNYLKERRGAEQQQEFEMFCQKINKEQEHYEHNQHLITKLCTLLEQLDKSLTDVRRLLNRSLPDDSDYEFDAKKFPDIRSMVEELWNITDDENLTHGTLWRLAYNVVNSELSDGIKQQFREWLTEIQEDSDRILPKDSIDKPSKVADGIGNSLLIEVCSQYLPEGEIQIRAWIYKEGEGKYPKLIESPDDNETIRFDEQSLKQRILEIVEITHNSAIKFDRIEIFLPIEYLLFPIDQLTYLDDLGDLAKWAHSYPIIVRSRDRAIGNWRQKWAVQEAWKRKWQHVNDDASKLIKLHNINTNFQELKNLLDGNDQVVCGCVIFPPTDPCRMQEILKRLIYNGVPVIFWFHKDIFEKFTSTDILSRVLDEMRIQGVPVPNTSQEKFLDIEELPQIVSLIMPLRALEQIVSEARRSDEARNSTNQDHIGNNWALLWDDPERLPAP